MSAKDAAKDAIKESIIKSVMYEAASLTVNYGIIGKGSSYDNVTSFAVFISNILYRMGYPQIVTDSETTRFAVTTVLTALSGLGLNAVVGNGVNAKTFLKSIMLVAFSNGTTKMILSDITNKQSNRKKTLGR